MLNFVSMVKAGKKEDLAQFVRRIRESKKLSVNDVALRSEGGISKAYVSQIENHYVKSVTSDRLRALSRGLGISFAEIAAVAGGGDPLSEEQFLESLFGEIYRDYK